jgi:hypothetical protein
MTRSPRYWTRTGAIGAKACTTPDAMRPHSGPVKHGGQNFIQVGKITFEVGSERLELMASYISSNANRFYTGLESSYGATPPITSTEPISGREVDSQEPIGDCRPERQDGQPDVRRNTNRAAAQLLALTCYDLHDELGRGKVRGRLMGRFFRPALGPLRSMYAGGAAAAGCSGTIAGLYSTAWPDGRPGRILQRRGPFCNGNRESRLPCR